MRKQSKKMHQKVLNNCIEDHERKGSQIFCIFTAKVKNKNKCDKKRVLKK